MSDLHCPARIFLAGEDAARAGTPLTERLRGERIAHVYRGSPAPAGLLEIADQHRGEAVLVVDCDEAVAATLVALGLPTDHPEDGAYVLLEHDADGWRLG